MYITPNTNITLYNIPLNRNSDDTLFFNDATSQRLYFADHRIATFNSCSYQRETVGKCRIERVVGDLYSANYMSFQNDNFGGKIFYAWVDNIEYINNVTTEITFTIDSIQTWFFEMDLGECFIERQHSTTDRIGDNIIGEGVALGEYVMNGAIKSPNTTPALDEYRIIVCVNATTQGGYTRYGNVFGAGELHVWSLQESGAAKTFLDSYIQQPDEVLAVYMCPAFCVNGLSGGAIVPVTSAGGFSIVSDSAITNSDTLDGYKPLNMKMYTYPYNFYNVFGCGGNLQLRYEFFDDLTPRLEITGTPALPVEVNAIPVSYKNVQPYSELGGFTIYPMEKITLKGYPLGSWKVDAYDAWLAQNSVPMAMSGGLTLLEMGASAMIGGGIGVSGATAIAHKVVNDLSTVYRASIQSDITKGNYQSGNDDYSSGRMKFYSGRMSISKDFARSIDNYFTMFGYKQDVVSKPNIHARSRYTYIKTIDAQVQGNMPIDHADNIATMFNNGLRFWSDYTNTGKYPDGVNPALNNSILP